MLSIFMLSEIYAECCIFIVTLIVVALSVVILSVMPSPILLSVFRLNDVMLSVIMLSVVILSVVMLGAVASSGQDEKNLATFFSSENELDFESLSLTPKIIFQTDC